MLPFGSITSIVPLFILGFAYLVYLGASVFCREAPQEIRQADEKSILMEDSYRNLPVIINFSDYEESCQQACTDKTHPPLTFFNSTVIIFEDTGVAKELSATMTSMFLPRPPPCCC